MSKQKYSERKEAARERARCIQLYLSINQISPDELAEYKAELEHLAIKNGLTKEFRAEGLI